MSDNTDNLSLWLSYYHTHLSASVSHFKAEVNDDFLSLKEDYLPCH